jgi:hypothetical protein
VCLGQGHFSLDGWLDPEVPGHHPAPDVQVIDEWILIDKSGVWDRVMTEFPVMQTDNCRQVWSSAMARISEVVNNSSDKVQKLERGLKRFLVLPPLFQKITVS